MVTTTHTQTTCARPSDSAKAKREAQAAGVRYGCHVDLAPDEQPDDCVKDYGDLDGCNFARRHRTREGCRYWQPVTARNVDP
jgi:hypothetical protein